MIVSKVNGKSYAACRKHLGNALDFVGGGSVANVRVMTVKGDRDPDGRTRYVCACKKPAVFYLYEVVERPELVEAEPAQPEAGAPVTGTARPEHCRGTHNGKHRDACVACGFKPDGSDW